MRRTAFIQGYASKDSAIEDAEDIKIRSSLSRASSRRHNRRDTVLPMLAINAHWMSSAFQQYRACIEFVEIEGSHSGAAFNFDELNTSAILLEGRGHPVSING
jgi:hypothetical protein